MTISRREFLTAAALSFAATRLGAQARQKWTGLGTTPTSPKHPLGILGSQIRHDSAGTATLTIPAAANGPHMPQDFVGLSYEVQQLVDPAFFSASNAGLIARFKALSSSGVLRLGGNTSEFGYWKPTPTSPEPEHPQTLEVAGEPKAQYYAVTRGAIRNLKDFLKATGWTCIYGIGMGTNTPERAAEEADFVAKTLGPSLQYFQIGNEADLFSHHLRDPKTWGVKPYLEEWLALARAVAARVAGAKFGMPDVASNASWLTTIADEWPGLQDRPLVTTVTHHYYFGGPATNPEVNITNLLKASTMTRVQKTADVATAAAARMDARVRMTEGNTCYRGGKPGVSDVFAAALWSADYSLLLASNNYSGVNLHGGTGKSVANSVGGFLPGDVLLKDQGKTPKEIATHPHPFYTPIGTFGSEYTLEPVAYGLKFAGLLCGSTFFPADFAGQLGPSGVNATAYAAKMAGGATSVIILNKDSEKDLSLTLHFEGEKSAAVHTDTLHAPALDSREAHITRSPRAGHLKEGRYSVVVQHAAGMRITVN